MNQRSYFHKTKFIKSQTIEKNITNKGNTITFEFFYPKENPSGCLGTVVRELENVGLFEGIDEIQNN